MIEAILIPRVASQSIADAIERSHVECDLKFAFVRYWKDRLASAVYSVLSAEMNPDDRIQQYIDAAEMAGCALDSHLRPQSSFLVGHDLDFLGRYEHFHADWKRLQQMCPGLADLPPYFIGTSRPRWQDAPITWSRWYPLYAEDAKLCPDYAL